ncbi:hypothetical protein [Kitasatospora phosalacinea]|uniref:Lipoprotein n=1 Tax=Kitasatospora phosalacinea TaxID=2065 RepID=A0ABW6GMZ1_9ACTN
MPRTPRPTSRTIVGRTAPRLAAALLVPLLVPLLAACGGDGGSGSGAASSAARSDGELGDSPPAEGSGEQPDDNRTGAGGNQGGFNAAGQVSANASGTWSLARIDLSSPRKDTFTATVSRVTDCTDRSKESAPATPASQQITVVDGTAPRTAEFTLVGPKPPAGTARTICLTVTVDGASRRVTADGAVDVPGNTSSGGSTGGSTGGPGSGPGSGPSDGTAPGSEAPDGEAPDGGASELPVPPSESASHR